MTSLKKISKTAAGKEVLPEFIKKKIQQSREWGEKNVTNDTWKRQND